MKILRVWNLFLALQFMHLQRPEEWHIAKKKKIKVHQQSFTCLIL